MLFATPTRTRRWYSPQLREDFTSLFSLRTSSDSAAVIERFDVRSMRVVRISSGRPSSWAKVRNIALRSTSSSTMTVTRSAPTTSAQRWASTWWLFRRQKLGETVRLLSAAKVFSSQVSYGAATPYLRYCCHEDGSRRPRLRSVMMTSMRSRPRASAASAARSPSTSQKCSLLMMTRPGEAAACRASLSKAARLFASPPRSFQPQDRSMRPSAAPWCAAFLPGYSTPCRTRSGLASASAACSAVVPVL